MKNLHNYLQTIFNNDSSFVWLTVLKDGHYKNYTYKDLESRFPIFFRCIASSIPKQSNILIIGDHGSSLFGSFFAALLLGHVPSYAPYPSDKQTKESLDDIINNIVNNNNIKLMVADAKFASKINLSKEVKKVTFPKASRLRLDFGDLEVIENTTISFMQFSSGTTGAKKGIKISWINLLRQIDSYSRILNTNANSKIVSWLPHYHDMGLIACMLMPFLKRLPIIMMSPFDWVRNPKIMLDAINRYNGTHVWLPNFALGHLSRNIDKGEIKNFSSLKQLRIICCSENLLKQIMMNFSTNLKN